MTRAIELRPVMRVGWSTTGLGYPSASVVVGVARDQDDRDTTGRTEDGTAR
jgi:hypothetical protein